jgi:hypothetical protein
MARQSTNSAVLGNAQRFHTSMETAVSQIPHLEAGRARLGERLGVAQDLAKQQAAATAAKQELSAQFQSAMSDVQLLATMLRKGVRQHFGIRSEKLAEFGLQPFRGRKAKKEAPTPATPETTPAPTNV